MHYYISVNLAVCKVLALYCQKLKMVCQSVQAWHFGYLCTETIHYFYPITHLQGHMLNKGRNTFFDPEKRAHLSNEDTFLGPISLNTNIHNYGYIYMYILACIPPQSLM